MIPPMKALVVATGGTALAALLLRAGELQSLSLVPGAAVAAGQIRSARVGAPVFRAAAPAKPAAPAAPAALQWGEVYAFPNPAKGVPPAVHAEVEGADRVVLTFYGASGDLLHSATLEGPPALVDDGRGLEPAYEYVWDGARDGVAYCQLSAFRGGREESRKTIRLAVMP